VTPDQILNLTANALLLMFVLSLPVIIAATVVGTLVSLVQALTQIQEQNIPFLFKLSVTVLVIFLTARWMGMELHQFAIQVFDQIQNAGSR
jgi:type III secretion protein S